MNSKCKQLSDLDIMILRSLSKGCKKARFDSFTYHKFATTDHHFNFLTEKIPCQYCLYRVNENELTL